MKPWLVRTISKVYAWEVVVRTCNAVITAEPFLCAMNLPRGPLCLTYGLYDTSIEYRHPTRSFSRYPIMIAYH
jgi:hypothetical protein